MAVDDHLRVAWQARRDGRGGLCEAMLTLAIAESGPGDAWAPLCRDRLLAGRPNHFLGAAATVERALVDPRVVASIEKLRGQYPPGRVRWMRFRAELATGPYTGESIPTGDLVADLIAPTAAEPAGLSIAETPSGEVMRAPGEAADEAAIYLAVLVAIALLLQAVATSRASRAA